MAKVAIFNTNAHAVNQYLINYKCVCGELNRYFCQTRVIASVCHSFSLVIALTFLYYSITTTYTIFFSILKFNLIFLRLAPHIFPFGLVVISRLRLISNCIRVTTYRFSNISLSELTFIIYRRWDIGRFCGTFNLLGIRTPNQENKPKYEEIFDHRINLKVSKPHHLWLQSL